MTRYIDCDWCAQRIDETGDEPSAEELNRMGFEEGVRRRPLRRG
jgi:hypothetical protein